MKAKTTATATTKRPPRAAKRSPSRAPGDKTAFIRSMPEATVSEIVAKAKEAGIVMASQLVYNIRSADRKRGAAGKEPALDEGAPPLPVLAQEAPVAPTHDEEASEALVLPPRGLARRPDPPAMTAAAFVASRPAHLTAKQIVAEGKDFGISFTTAFVYAERGKTQKKDVMAAKRKMSASEFVRSKPMTLSADAVIDAARAEGIEVRRGLVHSVRSALRKTKEPIPRGPSMTQTAFVRSRPRSIPVNDLIAEAAAMGINLQAGTVYAARTAMRKADRERKAATERPTGPSPSRAKAPAKDLEQDAIDFLKALGATLGLSRAIGILEHELSLVRRVLDR